VTHNGLRISLADAAKTGVEEGRGKTVRQLSRLWRYRNGRKPSSHPPETIEACQWGCDEGEQVIIKKADRILYDTSSGER
jgi:hypothetical protein